MAFAELRVVVCSQGIGETHNPIHSLELVSIEISNSDTDSADNFKPEFQVSCSDACFKNIYTLSTSMLRWWN